MPGHDYYVVHVYCMHHVCVTQLKGKSQGNHHECGLHAYLALVCLSEKSNLVLR